MREIILLSVLLVCSSAFTFSKLADAYASRHQTGYTVYNGELFVFGGAAGGDINLVSSYQNAVFAFNVTQNTWRLVTRMPTNQTAFPVVVIGDDAYLFGGAISTAKVDTTWKYSFINDTWQLVGTAIKPPFRSFAAMVKHPFYDRLVMTGGSRSATGDFFADVWEYTLETDTWSQQAVNAEGPGERSGQVAGVWNSSMYVFGGRRRGLMYNDVWRWDFAGNWDAIITTGNPPERKSSAVGAILPHGKMIIHGGGDQATGSGTQYNTISVLDLITKVWISFTPASNVGPSARIYHAGWFSEDHFYVSIGGNSGGLISDIWQIDDPAFLPGIPTSFTSSSTSDSSSSSVTSGSSGSTSSNIVSSAQTSSSSMSSGNSGSSVAIVTVPTPDKESNVVGIAVGASIGGVVLMAIVFIIAFFAFRRKDRPDVIYYATQLEPGNRTSSGVTTYSSIKPQSESPITSAEEIKMSLWNLDYNEIVLEGELGRGAYGIVYKGKWRNQNVAVKKFLDQITDEQKQEFIAECELIANIRPHENVIQLLGISTEPYSIVVKYYEEGSLYNYIEKGNPLPEKEIISLLKGIAAGVSHIHSEKMVHRDLACRNILLSRSKNGLNAVIADFGFTRKLTAGNSGTTRSTVGPVRWMAPESLRDQIYSYKSDVFSFGVIMWEMVARKLPWGEMDQVKVILAVLDGKTLEIPEKTPSELATLMKSCWRTNPEDRPTAQGLFDKLNAMA